MTLGGVIINGHVPALVDLSEGLHGRTTAMELVAADDCYVTPLAEMRRSFLGASDPARAVAGSLRNMAWRGDIDLKMKVDIEQNGFHLSAGHLEAERESTIWFGHRVEEDLTFFRHRQISRCMCHAFDRPGVDPSPAGWMFERTEGLDADRARAIWAAARCWK
jgi:hypothetical protein